MRTLEEQLESVQKAIEAIEGGGQELDVEVNQNRRRVSRADLRELYKRETQLKMAIKRKNGGGTLRSFW
jgi:methylphosphotriester-DNA--protein-cysteine methyltransferase